MLAAPASAGAVQSVVITAASVTHPSFQLRELSASLAGVAATSVRAGLSAREIRAGGIVLANPRLLCRELQFDARAMRCEGGALTPGLVPAQTISLRFSYTPDSGSVELALRPAADESWVVRSTRQRGEMTLRNARVQRLAPFVPSLASYHANGMADGTATWSTARGSHALSLALQLKQASFFDSSGEHAGEKLAGRIQARAEGAGDAWRWSGNLAWEAGEAYLKPFYVASGGHELDAAGTLDASRVSVSRARLRLADIAAVDLSGAWDRRAGTLAAARFVSGDIRLDKAAAVFLKPLLEQQALPPVDAAGTLRVAGEWGAGGLASLDVALADVSLREAGGRSAVSGVSGSIPWRRDSATHASVSAAGGSLGRVPLGAFKLDLVLRGFSFSVPRVEIPVLDGAVLVENLRAARHGEQWDWQVAGALYPISMPRLTAALGWPSMAGSVSASIPRISSRRSTVEMDGALIVQVFDGYLAMDNLKLIEPLGRLPRLYADMELRHLDLGQITDTFSFGSITGYVDGEVRGLELAAWRPQRFSARIQSSPGDYSRRISQRAVENISALGGGGATAAIQRSFLRFFKEFGYSRLGLSCVLDNGICEMGGIEPAAQGYVIVKGGGVPAINVIGYNRRVDWEELVSRLQRITSGNTQPVIQ